MEGLTRRFYRVKFNDIIIEAKDMKEVEKKLGRRAGDWAESESLTYEEVKQILREQGIILK